MEPKGTCALGRLSLTASMLGMIETEHRAVSRTPVGAVELREYDGHYPYTSHSEAGTFECSKHVGHND